MTFRVIVLGTASASPITKRNPTAHALNVCEQFYLVDCGEGTQRRLMQAGINPQKINTIFLSHLHGDHVYGIFGLISTLGLLGREQPLHIYAPHPFGEILESHFRYFDQNLPYRVLWHEVDTRKHELIYENKVLEVYSIPLRHRIPTSGYLFKEKEPKVNLRKEQIVRYDLGIAQCAAAKAGRDITLSSGEVIPNEELTYLPYRGRSYAYLSDTRYSAKAAGLVRGVDLLYHEATFAEADKAMAQRTGHSTAMQAAKAAVAAEAERLLIGHFSSRYKGEELLVQEARSLFPATEAAQEGMSYDIPLVRFNP